MNRGSGLLLFVFCFVLLGGCSTVNTRSVNHHSRLDYQGREYEIGGSGEVLEYPLRGKSGTYEIVTKHLGSSEGNVCLYSTTFYRRTYFFYLVVLAGVRKDFLTIVKWVEEDAESFYVLVHDFGTGPGSVIMERGTIKIEVDGSLHTIEADAVGSFHAYAMSYRLTPEIVVKLQNAQAIRVSYMKEVDQWRMLSDDQRSILQSFLVETEHITYKLRACSLMVP